MFTWKFLEWQRGLRFIINRLESNFIVKMNQLETLRTDIWQKKIEGMFFILNSKFASKSQRQLWEKIGKIPSKIRDLILDIFF